MSKTMNHSNTCHPTNVHHSESNNNTCHSGSHDASHGLGGHGTPKEFLNRFWVVSILLIPLLASTEFVSSLFEYNFSLSSVWQLVLITIIFAVGWVFFEHAWMEIKAREYGMMTLVSLAVAAGYLFSVAGLIFPSIQANFSIEIAALIWILLFGHYLEAKSGKAAGNALEEVSKLLPDKAFKKTKNDFEEVSASELKVTDIIRVRHGEKVPADGKVVDGSGSINQAHLTGESIPVSLQLGDEVSAGSILDQGSIEVLITAVGSNSSVGKLKALLNQAASSKPKSQRLADKWAGYLTFSALSVSILSFLIWYFIVGQTFVFAITIAISVLVIACPHALGLAIPAVTTISSRIASKHGIFIKNLAKLEVVNQSNLVVFDKTGTLTKGNFKVNDVVSLGNNSEADILQLAASVEVNSSHPIAKSVVNSATDKGIEISETSNFISHASDGVEANVDNKNVMVGKLSWLIDQGIKIDKSNKAKLIQLQNSGDTVIAVAINNELAGFISLGDEIRASAERSIRSLHEQGYEVVLMTGDNQIVADKVAKKLSINQVYAEVTPADKLNYIKQIQADGKKVIMVGDGVNDGPALSLADLGIAIGSGTAVASAAGDIILTTDDPASISNLVNIAKATLKKMKQNLWWALGYNIIAIPAAAGVLAPFGLLLPPAVGALVMAGSTVVVVLNALTLNRVDGQLAMTAN